MSLSMYQASAPVFVTMLSSLAALLEKAEAYAKERVELAKKHGLEIFTVAAHLQGQVLGDEPSAKTLNFLGPSADDFLIAFPLHRHSQNLQPAVHLGGPTS
jgi:hypothetical protein